MKREYSVAIRTLGTAGEKYQKLLDSIKEQTIRPKHIFVHIAEGYELPKETIGIEEYIRTPKGMITQRSQPFDEIDTEYVLFCDDDLYLPPDYMEKMFEALGFTPEEAQDRFGFLLNAFRYGVPPHGGLAYGLDRMIMLMTGCDSIRDCIAFPKVKDASDLMSEAPSPVDDTQLEELGIALREE